METGSRYHGRNVALYFAGKRPDNPAECPFKGHALEVVPSETFNEVLEVTSGTESVLLGKDEEDTYWMPLVRDMSGELCVRSRAPAFEIDIIP